ncbi:universal stress protein UspA [Mycobacterium sp. 852002-51613_SCH5001154]|uniref:universal stress protein n=1 Tax=unclassified Mycobacterium TaxID=2642494 RepID=UPI0008010F07|nr:MULTISPECIES: universal stress protein [unclassified Mycobacterium]OBF78342.1 universal stress protein UspA [Mycobacterium sp. 852002-51613_SCH5001154]OBF97576.1 universal stress protein UspA [Mycobacterium sp. 852014-52450_SCH5900713]
MSGPDQQRGIVVAVDGSKASNAAAIWAAHEAAMRKIPLTVVHAVTTPTATWPPVPYPESLAVRLEDEGKKAIMHAIKLAEEVLPADRKVAIHRELVYSSPALALINMSGEAELIVVGTAGRGLLARGVLGSVSATVVRHAHCPVAVIHGDDMPDVHNAPVVVGVDGSPASELAIEIAFDEASRRGVGLTALHAWSDITVSELPEADWSSLEAEAHRSLAENLAGWQERYPDVTVQRLVVRDGPARQLAEKSETAQLLVVGSHGRGGLTGVLLGSVSNAVLHSVRTPVIVARPGASA